MGSRIEKTNDEHKSGGINIYIYISKKDLSRQEDKSSTSKSRTPGQVGVFDLSSHQIFNILLSLKKNTSRMYDRYGTFDSTPQVQDPCIFVNVHEILVQYKRTYHRTCGVDDKSKYSARYATTFFSCSVEEFYEVAFIARTRTWCVVCTACVTASLALVITVGNVDKEEE